MRLQNRVAVITGGGTGIGRAIALAFADEGAELVVNYNRSKEAVEELIAALASRGKKALALQADVSDAEQVEAMAERVVAELGRVDILVNNAGVLLPAPLESLPRNEWIKVVNVNLNGVFFCTRAFGRHMIQRRRGIIINIASIAGIAPMVYGGAYSATKAAVIILTQQTALEWAKYGIRANAICPGPVRTNMLLSRYSPEKLEARAKTVPLGSIAEPEDVARLAVFLASDEAKYITGQSIAVDGGILPSLYRLIRQLSNGEQVS